MKRHERSLSLLLSVLLLAFALPLAAAGTGAPDAMRTSSMSQAAKASTNSPRRHGVSTTRTISGIVMSETSSQIVVRTRGGDVALKLTPQTHIGSAKTTVSVNVSNQVQVRVAKDTRGANVAVSIEVEPDVVEVQGVIQDIAGSTLTVRNGDGDTTVNTDDNTIIVVKGAIATIADLVVGDTVEVHGLPQADGSVLALLVVAEAENIEIHGVITAVDASSITVATDDGSDVTASISADTAIRISGQTATAADLHAGQRVEIDAQRAADGSLRRARRQGRGLGRVARDQRHRHRVNRHVAHDKDGARHRRHGRDHG